MKNYLIPLLALSALLSGCQHVGVRHSIHLPVVLSDHRHIDAGITIVHQHDGGHHSGHNHQHTAPRRVVVSQPRPVIRHTNVTVIEGDRYRRSPRREHRPAEHRESRRVVSPSTQHQRKPHWEGYSRAPTHTTRPVRVTQKPSASAPLRHKVRRIDPPQQRQHGRTTKEVTRQVKTRHQRVVTAKVTRTSKKRKGAEVKRGKKRQQRNPDNEQQEEQEERHPRR